MQIIDLSGKWELKYRVQQQRPTAITANTFETDWKEIAAEVPGNVELDLMRSGIVPDLTKANNVYQAIEFEKYEWLYSKSFSVPEKLSSKEIKLIFEGIDCFASISLNGQEIGYADNMLISHSFEVSKILNNPGKNLLEVHIISAVEEGRKKAHLPDNYAFEGNWEALRVRKAPHMYGWDIAPRIVSAGLWRGVRLETVETTRFREVYWGTIDVDLKSKSASLMLDWDIATDISDLYALKLSIQIERLGKKVYSCEKPLLGVHGKEFIDLQCVDFWWPRGFGEPNRYDMLVQLLDENGRVIAESKEQTGIRTIKLKRTELSSGNADGDFSFIVNKQKIFIKGTNWIPLDAFHSRDKQHLAKTFDMVLDLNCNMLRCWGGSVYEDHDFFDLCDANGILVWQDFALACAIYPQDQDFIDQIKREAESVIKKIRNHPSLALWCGNNEIDSAYYVWTPLKQDPNLCDNISRKVLAEMVRRLDPLRDYLPSSPYYGPELIERGVPHNMKPEDHLWGPRDNFKGEFYTSSNAYFVSETGYHGCPCIESMHEMLDPDHLWPWQKNGQWLTRAVRPLPQQSAYDYRIPLMAKQIEILFGEVPGNPEDFILASQISQAEALKFFIEKWRSGKWPRSGIIWWNLKDCWPIISDSTVDYYYRKKIAYYYVKKSQSDICAVITEPDNGMHKLIIVNDTNEAVCGHIQLQDFESGKTLYDGQFNIDANGKIEVTGIEAVFKPALRIMEMTISGRDEIFRNHYVAGNHPFEFKKYKKWLKILLPSGRSDKQNAIKTKNC